MSYDTEVCPICTSLGVEKEVSVGGAARTSHMRAHVRRGEAKETKHEGKLLFLPINETEEYIDPEPYAKLGHEPLSHQPDGVWDITEALQDLVEDFPDGIDPINYFITSGEAVKKAEKLVGDLYSLAVSTRSFKKKLEKAKGPAKYLETQRENTKLLIKRKSPRKKRQ